MVWLLAPGAAAGQGLPYLRQYAPRDYRAGERNYAIAAHPLGLLFVANEQGLLEYDGHMWRRVPTDGAPLTLLAFGPDGFLYGSDGLRLGRLLTEDGRHRWVWLQGPGGMGSIQRLWPTPHGVYASTRSGVYRLLQGVVAACQVLGPAGKPLPRTQMLHHPGEGLLYADSTRLYRVTASPLLHDVPVVAVTQVRPGVALAATERGVFRFDGYRLQRFPLPGNLADLRLSDLLYLRSGLLAVATLRGGMVLLNTSGVQLARVDRTVGLLNETLHSLCFDAEGGLWMAMEAGLARADILSPTTFLGASNGLKGAIHALQEVQDTLFVGTDLGLYRLPIARQPPQFDAVAGLVRRVEALVQLGPRLVVGGEEGLYIRHNGRLQRISAQAVRGLALRSGRAPQVYVATAGGIRVLGFTQVTERRPVVVRRGLRRRTTYVETKRDTLLLDSKPLTDLPADQLVADAAGALWALAGRNVYRIVPPKAKGDSLQLVRMDAESGVPDAPQRLLQVRGVLHVASKDGKVFAWDGAAARFIPDPGLSGSSFVYEDGYRDRVAVVGNDLRFGRAGAQGYEWDSTALRLEREGPLQVALRATPRRLWLGFERGLIQFDPGQRQYTPPPFPVLVRGIRLANDSLSYAGGIVGDTNLHMGDTIVYPARSVPADLVATLSLDLAGVHFGSEGDLQYQYALRDATDSLRWSGWMSGGSVQLSGLESGSYRVFLRSRDAQGRESRLTVLPLRVVPPWYRTWWAYALFTLGGVVLLSGVGYGSARIYSFNLVRRNRRLERLIAQRTREIEDKNHELGAQNEEIRRQKEQIEEKNRDITDSLLYAERIQRAMLPRADLLRKSVPEHFLIFQPRDIVSGDFYWLSRGSDGSLLIAVADCTGHGVPGALMSMIGTSLLTRIVSEQRQTDPARILDLLDEGVRNALGQNLTNATHALIDDGMDICVIRVHQGSGSLLSAAANRPVWVLIDGTLSEIPGSRRPIGGRRETTPFALHQQMLPEGSRIYLFSDGVTDQFGGPDGRKFQYRRLREVLLRIQHLPMREQGEEMRRTINDWRGHFPQLDDILVLGLKF